MDDHHEVDSTSVVLELEATAGVFVVEDGSTIDPVLMDEIVMKRLRKLHESRDPKSRHGALPTPMAQFSLLQKMGAKRLAEDPKDDVERSTHKCNHCKKRASAPWKSKDKARKRTIEGSGSHCVARA